MKKFKFSKVSIAILTIAFMLGLAGPITVQAATTPYLGTIDPYGVVSSTFTNSNTAPHTIVDGKVCYTTVNLLPLSITGGVSDTPCINGADQTAALTDLNAQVVASCISLGVGAVNLDNVTGHLTGVYTPGCYTSGGAMNITTGATVTLNGAGTYIFKPGGALTTEADTFVTLTGGASACDVFWVPTGATTLGAFTTGGIPPVVPTFIGTIFRGNAAGLSITLGHFANLLGRTMAFGSTVTTDANTITVPTGCTATSAPSSAGNYNTITVIKQVINDSGGTATYSDFPLFINGNSTASGQTKSFAPGIYTITETNLPGYTRTFTGNCDANGLINHGGVGTHSDICTVVNNDIGTPPVALVPPLIDVLKVPSPLALPAGPGLVTYTYTTRNIGTIPMTNITLVGDTCSPIVLSSGDTNGDLKLDLNETWIYTCSTTLLATHTNTVVATGHANGMTAIDAASATVVVGAPIVPPLIHITKVPNPLTLPSGAGMVTYTKKVTNPGTVALSNVSVTDDKCSPITYISGDTNNNSKLDITETWIYTCRTRLIQTTTNTAIATGSANGLTATDFALATVVVAVPGLPKTGFPSEEKNTMFPIIMLSGLSAFSIFLYFARKKQTT